MHRRAFCAGAAGMGLAGCLNLQEEGTNGGSGDPETGSSGSGSDGPGAGPGVVPIDDLSLSAAWELERGFAHLGTAAGSFFGWGFRELVRVEPDGTETWTSDAVGDEYSVRPANAIDGNDETIFVGTNATGDVDRAQLYALEADSGQVRWHDETAPTGTRTRIDHVVVTDAAVVYGSDTTGTDDDQDAVVRGIDPQTGEERWTDEFHETFVVGLERVDDRVFVGTTDRLFCYNAADGERVATFDVLSGFEGVAGNGTACYGYDRTANEIVAVDGGELERRWSQPIDYQPEGIGVGSGLVSVSTDAGYVVAYDAASGAQQWDVRLDGPAHGDPVPDGNRVWAADDDGTLAGIAAADGELVLETEIGDGGGIDVGIVDDVLLTDADETAFAIDAS